MVPINVFLQSVHMRKLVVHFALYQEDTGLGGKGGKGGDNEGVKNGFGTTPYFLVIADDQEGWEAFSEALSSISSFLIRLLVICEAEKIFLY